MSKSTEADALALFRLEGRVAFLSGASGWLGRSMARALAFAGAHVILNGRREEPLAALVRGLTSSGMKATMACFDITDEIALQKNIDCISREHGRLHIVVNNASSARSGNIETVSAADFEEVYKSNVLAAFNILKLSLPLLKKAAGSCDGGASVINIASMYGSVSPNLSVYGANGMDNPPSYGAAKAGLIQLTRYAACQLGPERIRVNCISPGPFPSDQVLVRDPDFRRRLSQKTPLLRIGSPVELTGPLLFLASDASSYVTGANLAVDGGWTAW